MTREQALGLVARWEHGDEAHRQWLRDVAVPDLMAVDEDWLSKTVSTESKPHPVSE